MFLCFSFAIAFCEDYYSYIIAADIIMADAWENERRRRRVFLHAAMEGNLDLLICNSVGHARIAVELRKGTGACGHRAVNLAAASGRTSIVATRRCSWLPRLATPQWWLNSWIMAMAPDSTGYPASLGRYNDTCQLGRSPRLLLSGRIDVLLS
jgi:hypothetical protein